MRRARAGVSFHDAEAQEMMRTVAANYEKLARQLEHLAV
jgi:hypothetical protein